VLRDRNSINVLVGEIGDLPIGCYELRPRQSRALGFNFLTGKVHHTLENVDFATQLRK
jgi:hypothetical protein